MKPCVEHVEDLALLCAGDLPDAPAAMLRHHLAACAACERLLTRLAADHEALTVLVATQPDDGAVSVVGPVMAKLTAQACADAHLTAPPMPRRPHGNWASFATAAAIVLAVVGASTLGMAVLQGGHEESAGQVPAPASSPGSAPTGVAQQSQGLAALHAGAGTGGDAKALGAQSDGLPVFLKRAAENGVMLTWAADGREAAGRGAPAYRVLASGSPKDFGSARPIEVAGSQLVASLAWPETSLGDRSITFFRVE